MVAAAGSVVEHSGHVAGPVGGKLCYWGEKPYNDSYSARAMKHGVHVPSSCRSLSSPLTGVSALVAVPTEHASSGFLVVSSRTAAGTVGIK